MILFRFLIVAFNVAAITFLVFQLLQVIKQDIKPGKRFLVLFSGIVLLSVPVAMILKIIPLNMTYFLIYPVVVYLFVYFIKESK